MPGDLGSDFNTIAHCETNQGLQRVLDGFIKPFKETQEANFRPLTAFKDVLNGERLWCHTVSAMKF